MKFNHSTKNRESGSTFKRCFVALSAAIGIVLNHALVARADDVVAYRFGSYQEDAGRVQVETQTVLFDTKLTPWLTLAGNMVHDAISGASPTGSPPPSQINFVPPALGGPDGPFSSSVPVQELHDIRWAGSLSPTFTYGANRMTPQFSYSEEHDYVSYGTSFNYSLDLNQKNTTLNLGWAHNFDRVRPAGFLRKTGHKDGDDFLIGVNQLLGPKTVLTFNLSYKNEHGYLNDQYKGVLFGDDFQLDPENPALRAEKRPQHRFRYVPYVSITQDIEKLHAAVEASYRFYNDSYGINAHAVELAWLQKLGKRVMISPTFRYYRQSGADFYATQFPDSTAAPTYYSSDYRLSELETLTGGINVYWKIRDWVGLDAGFKRYVMRGLDGATSQSAYPAANVYSIGARIWF